MVSDRNAGHELVVRALAITYSKSSFNWVSFSGQIYTASFALGGSGRGSTFVASRLWPCFDLEGPSSSDWRAFNDHVASVQLIDAPLAGTLIVSGEGEPS